MTRRLVIVESPAKARTIAGYLGEGYVVEASVGHIRDLPQPSELPADESSKGQVPVDCTNVPNDPILLALADAARDWASAQDFDQLRSALIGLLSMTNHRP